MGCNEKTLIQNLGESHILKIHVAVSYYMSHVHIISHAGGVALWTVRSACGITMLFQTGISSRLFDGLP